MRQNAIISCILLLFHNVCCNPDEWVEPHAWGDSCQCPPLNSLATIEDQLALMYFKKFVNNLFNPNKLLYSRKSMQFKRSLLFTLRQSQIDELQAVQDVRDLDIMLTTIMEEATDEPLSSDYTPYTHQGMEVLELITDIFKDFVQLLRITEVKFMAILLLAFATGCIVKKRFRFSAKAVIIGGILLYGYFFTYLECNRKLEVEQMIEAIDSNQKSTNNSLEKWFSRIYGYFQSPKWDQKQKLLKSNQWILPYCRPDHVFIMYINDIFLKQVDIILGKTAQSITNLNSELSFPFNLMAPLFVISTVGFLLYLTFKFLLSPQAWVGRTRRRSSAPAANPQPSVEDRLSGENLKMLLNVVSQKQPKLKLPVSGVQELVEPQQALSWPSNESQSESNPNSDPVSNKNPNLSNSSEDIAKEAGFTVVDDNENDEHIESC